jgi:DNA-binding NarL/FixJ family response regulator
VKKKVLIEDEVKKGISDVLPGIGSSSLKMAERLPDLKSSKPANPFERLSEKERLLAIYYLKGHTNREVKNMLRLHASTIGTMKSRLFGKLKIKSLIELVELARIYQPGILGFQK